MRAFEIRSFNDELVGSTRLEGLRCRALHCRMHSFNRRTVAERFRGHRIGIGNEVPDRIGVFIGFDVIQQKHFDRGELKAAIEPESDRIHGRVIAFAPRRYRAQWPRPMINLRNIFGEPLAIEVKRTGGEENR